MGGQRFGNGETDNQRQAGETASADLPGAAGGQADTPSGSTPPGFGDAPFGQDGAAQDNTSQGNAPSGNGGRMQPPGGMGGGPFGGWDGTGNLGGDIPLPDGQPDTAPDNASDNGQGNPQSGMPSPFGGTPGARSDGGAPDLPEAPAFGGGQGGLDGGMPGGGMPDGFGSGGGSDLVYTDDDPESYSDIFDGAVFDPDQSDYQRVVTALQKLSAGEELEACVDVDEALRYFAVNTLLVNLDSYVGSLKHNYYLYEKDGRLSILPWDFNLAFAGFQGGSASSAVNFPIDTPVSGTTLDDRPLLGKLLEVEAYKDLYHQYLQEIVTGYFDSGLFVSTVETIDGLIGGLVEGDPTAFYSYTAYETARDTLLAFGKLRAQSVQGQLDGSIPSTSDGQSADSAALVDASSIDLSHMGTQGGGMDGMDRRGGFVQGDGQGGEDGGTTDPQAGSPALPGAKKTEEQDGGGSLPALPKEGDAEAAQSPSARSDGRQSGASAGQLDAASQNRLPGQNQPAQDSAPASQTDGLRKLLITLAASLALPALGAGFMILYLRTGRRSVS
ncbi:MAG: hypothetical protein HFE86_04880 [Clostridiales bacterium]|nr:hypothetical protein [Clostridiales bacterium]